MSWKKLRKLSATVGEYTDNQGNKKRQYLTIGYEWQKDDGHTAFKIDSIPVGWTGWFSSYPLDEQRQVQQDRQTVAGYQTEPSQNDDLPF